MLKKTSLLFLLILVITSVSAQNKKKKYQIRTIAFYNLENLFDTINDVTKNDEASPIMALKSNRRAIYNDKIEKLASTIAQIGIEKTKTAPAIIGVAEVENNNVLEDLITSNYLAKYNYDIIHYNSPDIRGIDVALLYQKKYFKPIHHEVFNPKIYKNNFPVYTRDQLLVSGFLDDELIHIIVNHWPSRSGGQQKSNPLREKAAYQNLKIIEQIRKNDPNGKILSMGDFNDDPINNSFKKVLKTKSRKRRVQENDLFNPYEDLYRRGFNTLVYRDKLNLFDMIYVSSPLLSSKKKDYISYKMFKAMIFNKRFLTNQKGKYKGYPFRSFLNGNYTGGYSDHYPVYLYLIKEQLN